MEKQSQEIEKYKRETAKLMKENNQLQIDYRNAKKGRAPASRATSGGR